MSDMYISTAEAKNRLHELIRMFECGETVVITRHGLPVVQLAPPPPDRRQKVRLGGMKDDTSLTSGWDAPSNLKRFLKSDL
jgi:prevent-host-death family protein